MPSLNDLKILHILRAPLGGAFRHVMDIATAQAQGGHHVGLIYDAYLQDSRSAHFLAQLAPSLTFGLHPIPMCQGLPLWKDWKAIAKVIHLEYALEPDVIHAHGPKAALLTRVFRHVLGCQKTARVYTLHGGVHFPAHSLKSFIYTWTERFLKSKTDLFIFESLYAQQKLWKNFKESHHAPSRLIYNGISPQEFIPVEQDENPVEFVGIGELSWVKGWDTLLEALVYIKTHMGQTPRFLLIGTGAEKDRLEKKVAECGLTSQVTFSTPMPARQGFAKGHVLVIPSWSDSLPYILIEAAGAHIPIVSTSVGGIPEIFGPFQDQLVPPQDAQALANKMMEVLNQSEEQRDQTRDALAAWVKSHFQISQMVEKIMYAYEEAIKIHRQKYRS